VPLYTPECGSCKFCRSDKTNLCARIRATQVSPRPIPVWHVTLCTIAWACVQGRGLMPDGTSRFRSAATGEPIYHFMGCSTFRSGPSGFSPL